MGNFPSPKTVRTGNTLLFAQSWRSVSLSLGPRHAARGILIFSWDSGNWSLSPFRPRHGAHGSYLLMLISDLRAWCCNSVKLSWASATCSFPSPHLLVTISAWKTYGMYSGPSALLRPVSSRLDLSVVPFSQSNYDHSHETLMLAGRFTFPPRLRRRLMKFMARSGIAGPHAFMRSTQNCSPPWHSGWVNWWLAERSSVVHLSTSHLVGVLGSRASHETVILWLHHIWMSHTFILWLFNCAHSCGSSILRMGLFGGIAAHKFLGDFPEEYLPLSHLCSHKQP